MNELLKNINLTESFIIGWKISNNIFIIYLDFLLTEDHKDYSKFDSKHNFGCYRLGIFKFVNFRNLSGIEAVKFPPIWDDKLNEYKDIDDVNSVEFLNNFVKIQTDSKIISMNFYDLTIEILNEGEKFDIEI